MNHFQNYGVEDELELPISCFNAAPPFRGNKTLSARKCREHSRSRSAFALACAAFE
jgi:hypothetical protein